MMNNWPTQANATAFYGDPRQPGFVANHLTPVAVPWKMAMGSTPVTHISINKKCADSLGRVLNAIWEAAGKNQATISAWGMDKFSGSYNYRPIRGGTHLSMHAYGAAVDFDAPENPLGVKNAKFSHEPAVLKAWADEGWVWGGVWSRPDDMHWQAARVR